jgi:hypothetical protein
MKGKFSTFPSSKFSAARHKSPRFALVTFLKRFHWVLIEIDVQVDLNSSWVWCPRVLFLHVNQYSMIFYTFAFMSVYTLFFPMFYCRDKERVRDYI